MEKLKLGGLEVSISNYQDLIVANIQEVPNFIAYKRALNETLKMLHKRYSSNFKFQIKGSYFEGGSLCNAEVTLE